MTSAPELCEKWERSLSGVGVVGPHPANVLYEIIEDIRGAYRMAMEYQQVHDDIIDAVQDEVRDYIERAYGDL